MNPNFKIIPAIDILAGKVVRLTQGDYAKVQNFSESALTWAKKFEDAGATRIHLVDLDGAKEGKLTNRKTFETIRGSVKCELELGGGIRSLANTEELFALGIDFLILGSLLVKNREESEKIIKKYPKKIIAGIDAKGDDVALQGWLEKSGVSVTSLLEELRGLPIDSVIYTDISRDGMMAGPNLEGLEKIASQSPFPVIASGGIRDERDIEKTKKLAPNGVCGCIVGKAILSGAIDLKNLFRYTNQ